MADIDAKKIGELRSLLAEKATPGPWVFEETRARIRARTALEDRDNNGGR